MKIMKRNGSEAAFDREKIAAAITKANLATDQPPELSGGQVAQLALSVEQAAARMGRTLSVEEIQGIYTVSTKDKAEAAAAMLEKRPGRYTCE